MKVWHFLKEGGITGEGNLQVVVGGTMTCDPEKLCPCKYGFHGSTRAIDALFYAPGPWMQRAELGGRIIEDADKHVASQRTCLVMADATAVLREFARWCALQVIHMWAAPDVVRTYLETGNEDLRAAAADAARAAAVDAARAAAVEAAMEGVKCGADALRGAARAAAVDAARAATVDAAWDAAWEAAVEAVRAAAWGAARDAVWEAARAAQNAKLEDLLRHLLTDQAWAEYKRATARAWAEYLRANAMARAEYERTAALAFARLYCLEAGQ